MLWTNLKEHRLKALFCTEWSPWKVLEFVQKGYKPWLNRAFPEVHSQILTGTTWSTYKKYLHRWLISGYRWWILRVSGVVWFCLRKTRLDTPCCYSWWFKTTWHPPHGAVLSGPGALKFFFLASTSVASMVSYFQGFSDGGGIRLQIADLISSSQWAFLFPVPWLLQSCIQKLPASLIFSSIAFCIFVVNWRVIWVLIFFILVQYLSR